MNYKIIEVSDRPQQAPQEFCVFEYKGDKYVFCPIRNKLINVNHKPEEIVRQYWLYRLKEVYGYSFEQMGVEVKVRVGSTEAKKKADIVVYMDESRATPRIFVEVKKPNVKEGIEQLKTYMNVTGGRLGLWSNGDPPYVYLLRTPAQNLDEKDTWKEIRNIPGKNESLAAIDTPIERRDLIPIKDFLSIVRSCEDYIKAHEGADAFNEIFKLIIAKLYDEKVNLKNDHSEAEFRIGVLESAKDARIRIENLFNDAQKRWPGIFEKNEEILLEDNSLGFCVSSLQKAYLLKSPADVLGAAFEVMVNPEMKGNKGQYFTPRYIIKMCIDVLHPHDGETVFDPACGSGGFLVGALDYVYQCIESERDDKNEIIDNEKEYAQNYIYGMDYDPKVAKVAKAYMLIWGDGRSNIEAGDSLNSVNWNDDAKSKFLQEDPLTHKLVPRQFDIIATNPPFAGDMDTDETLSQYELAFKPQKNGSRKRVTKLGKEKLFIERCLKMLVPGGRMAIVLPRGILKNYSDERIRRFIVREARILGVVGLGSNIFKPYTNTKTVVLFLQKRYVPLKDDKSIDALSMNESIPFCVTEKPGKDKAGKVVLDKNGDVVSDFPEITRFLIKNITYQTREQFESINAVSIS